MLEKLNAFPDMISLLESVVEINRKTIQYDKTEVRVNNLEKNYNKYQEDQSTLEKEMENLQTRIFYLEDKAIQQSAFDEYSKDIESKHTDINYELE